MDRGNRAANEPRHRQAFKTLTPYSLRSLSKLDVVLYGAIPSEDYPFMGAALAIVVLLLLPATAASSRSRRPRCIM